MKGNRLLKNIARDTASYLKLHSSTLLAIAGSAGVIATSVLTTKSTIKAVRIIDEAECERKEELNKREKILITATTYIPPLIMGTTTIVCIFASNILNKKQQSALISAYALVDNSFREYKKKLKELYGEETHNNIINSIMIEKAEETNVYAEGLTGCYNLLVDAHTGKPILFYDEFSQRYFESTIEQVINAEYHFNRNFAMRGYCFLNELYEFLGLEQTDYGDAVGWAVEDELYWVDFDHPKKVLENGIECYILRTPFMPTTDLLDYRYI